MTITKIEHMINPEVLASMVDGELEFAIKFAPLATVDHTLVGRPGNTVSLPAYKMIGEAVDVAEGEAKTSGFIMFCNLVIVIFDTFLHVYKLLFK